MDWESGLDIGKLIDKYGYIALVAGGPLAATIFIRLVMGRSRSVTVLFQFSLAWLVTKLFLLPHANAIESTMASIESFLRHHGI